MSLPILRPYQEAALDSYSHAVRMGKRAPCIVFPTGAGKTVTAAAAVSRAIRKGKRVVWFAHRRELVKQAVKTLAGFGLEVGAHGYNRSSRLQVCSVQGVLHKGETPEADLAIFDEARHYVSDRWFSLYEVYKDVFRMGLDATPERGDGRGITPLFDHLIVGCTYRDLREMNEHDPNVGLVACTVETPKRFIAKSKLALEPYEAYLRYTPNRSAVVFCPNKASSAKFMADFWKRGIQATEVHDGLPGEVRDARLHAFAEGCFGRGVKGKTPIKVICNVQILTEGWDCPGAEVAIIARKPGTAGLWIQMLGRVLRPSVQSGKTQAWVLDLVNGAELYGGPDTEYTYELDGIAIRRKGSVSEVRYCACGGILEEGACSNGCQIAGCGAVVPEVPEGQGVELHKFAGMRTLSPSKRAVVVARWIAKSVGKKHANTEGHVRHKYEYIFGETLHPDIMRQAMRMSARFY